MADVVFIAVTVAFFGLAVLLVRFCDRVIGPAEEGAASTPAPVAEDVAA